MAGCDINPDWNAPSCTEPEFISLTGNGEPWIAVYPDVITGNPLNAPVVVRYMLNREGVIQGNNIDAGDDDLFFWYREEFADKELGPNVFSIENYDLDLFIDDSPIKDLDLLYINRLPHSVIEYEKLPKGITLLSMENPLSLKELAATLKRARVLYSYESSGTCALANLCGCPVVSLKAPGFEDFAISEQTLKDNGGAGFTDSDAPESLASVRASLYIVRDKVLSRRKNVDIQLDNFLQLTQDAARNKHVMVLPHSLGEWGSNRKLLTSGTTSSCRILHIVFCRQSSLEDIASTVDSIIPGFDESQNILLMVGLPPHFSMDDGKKVFAATEGDWLEIVNTLALDERFDWLHCIDAGVCYAAEGIPLMQRLLLEAGDCRAIYTDEILKRTDGTSGPCFKPDFNLDLFLSSPQRYLRRVYFQRESWLEMGGFVASFSSSFEFELVVQYIFQWDLSCIGHISEVTTIVPERIFNESHPIEEKQVIENYLKVRGFEQGWAEPRAHGAWNICYQKESVGKISVLMDAGYDSKLLQHCLNNLLNNTGWPDFEVLISVPYDANEDLNLGVMTLVETNENIRMYQSESGKNVAQRMNLLEHQAEGDYLLLLSVHTLFIMKNWLSALMNHIVRPEVGCVGPKIISPEKNILSAGIIAGLDGWLGHIGQGENWLNEGYLSRFHCEQNYSALSSHCLLINRNAWQSVGGMDADYDNKYTVDVIISLKLRMAGLLCVWTPYSIIASDNPYILRSSSLQGRDEQMTKMVVSMPEIFVNDPNYNRNLSLSRPFYPVENLATYWDPLSLSKVPLILVVGDEKERSNSRRMRQLLIRMETAGQVRLIFANETPLQTEFMRMKPAVLILCGDLSKVSFVHLDMLKNSFPCRIIALADDIDDNSTVQWKSVPVNLWLTFYSTQRAFLKKQKLEVELMPSGLPEQWFVMKERKKARSTNTKARILCIPRDWKQRELNFMQSVIAASKADVDWVILGEWPTSWIPYLKETWRFRQGDICPEQLRELNIDLAVIFHNNNDSSHNRDAHLIYQLAACEIPVIASDVAVLECAIPATKVKADLKKWLRAIKGFTCDFALREINKNKSFLLAKECYQLTDADLKVMYGYLISNDKQPV